MREREFLFILREREIWRNLEKRTKRERVREGGGEREKERARSAEEEEQAARPSWSGESREREQNEIQTKKVNKRTSRFFLFFCFLNTRVVFFSTRRGKGA